MTDKAIITASLVDVRNLNTEKSVKLTLHVPAELAGSVFEAFGWPTATNPVPVALARLNPDAKPTVSQPEAAQKPRTPFSELPYAQQAAMRGQEPEFARFLADKHGEDYASADNHVPTAVRKICGVDSRGEFDKQEDAAARWRSLEADYYAWSRGMR